MKIERAPSSSIKPVSITIETTSDANKILFWLSRALDPWHRQALTGPEELELKTFIKELKEKLL